jgi:ABC-2 type transport system permease protein
MLGGNFIQVTDAPEIFRTLSLFTPNGWALRGFFDLSAEGGGIGSILPALGAIIAFGVVAGALALGVGRRLVTR